MIKPLINQIKIELLEKLTVAEKHEIVKILKEKYKLSFREIGRRIGVDHTTITAWYAQTPRGAGRYKTTMSISTIKKYFTEIHKKPSGYEEINQVKELILILMEWTKK